MATPVERFQPEDEIICAVSRCAGSRYERKGHVPSSLNLPMQPLFSNVVCIALLDLCTIRCGPPGSLFARLRKKPGFVNARPQWDYSESFCRVEREQTPARKARNPRLPWIIGTVLFTQPGWQEGTESRLQELEGSSVALCPRNSYARDDLLLPMHRPRAKGRLNLIKRCKKIVGQKVHGSLRKDVQPRQFCSRRPARSGIINCFIFT
jgi:hypothetical protein